MVIKLVRKAVYRWGFRPPLGSVFYSPTLDFYYALPDLSAIFAEGMTKAMAYSEEQYQKDSEILAAMLEENDLPPGIITTIRLGEGNTPVSMEDIEKALAEVSERDWFEEPQHKSTGDENSLFFCPLCGRPLDFDHTNFLFLCTTHGNYDFSMGVGVNGPEVIVKSVRPNG